MPIISRTLTKLANREDIAPGWKRWRVDGVDGRGEGWVHGPFGGTLEDAEAIRDAAWPQDLLYEHDESVGVEFVENGGDPSAYVPEDITLNEWRKRLARRFWRGTIEENRNFLCRVAPYIAGFTANQIANVLGISVAKAQLGIDKAVDLRDNVCPAMLDVDGKAEDV